MNLKYYNKLFLLGVSVSLIVAGFTFNETPYQAYAQSSQDELEDQIDQAREDILEYDQKIVDQGKVIKEKDENLQKAKDTLREVKSELDTSWTAYQNIEKAEDSVRDWEEALDVARGEFSKLISERSNLYKFIRENEIKLFEPESITQTQKADLSGLVKLIGINLSQSCLVLIGIGDETCPTYRTLISLDSSNMEISGGFMSVPPYERKSTDVQNSWRWYDLQEEPRIIVDPPPGMTERIKHITIVPHLDNYTLRYDMGTNGTRVLFHDRYIENCKYAVISAKVWVQVLPITIHDLRTGCEDSQFEEREEIIIEKTEVDITTSPNYQYQQ